MTDFRASRATLIDGYVNSEVENRESRKVAGICVRRGCARRCADDSLYCRRHAELQRKYQASYMRRKRTEWLRSGSCTNCGAEKRKRGSMWCPACAIRDERVPLSSVSSQVENHRDRVSKRLIPWEGSPQNAGRVRLRGGNRGRPKLEDEDRRDLTDVRRALDRYAMALDEAFGEEVAALSPMQREAARRAAYAWLALAVRTGALTLTRHRHEIPTVDDVVDDDEA